MLERILPSEVEVVSTPVDWSDASLFPEEESVVVNAVEKRRREFSTARACARRALCRLGFPSQPIPSGPAGEPLWPTGVVGSITHCNDYRACALARSDDIASLGIDAEANEPLPRGVLPDIALIQEQAALRRLSRTTPGVSWDRLLFSAKEAVYKSWFPLAGRWLGFEDAVVTIEPERGTFAARLLVPGPRLGGRELRGFEGRWLARDGLIATAIALPAARDAPVGPGLASGGGGQEDRG